MLLRQYFMIFCYLLFLGIQTSLLAQSPEAEEFPPVVPTFDTYDFTLSERLVQSVSASTGSILVAYPIYALKFDAQAGQPINLSPKHLYNGIGPLLIRNVPLSSGILLSNYFLGGGGDASPEEQLFAGVGSGIVSAVLYTPVELVITQQRLEGVSASHAQDQILSREGFRGLTRGMKATIFRDIVYGLGLFVIPEVISQNISVSSEDEDLVDLGVYAASGMIAGVVSTPLDTARGVIQRKKFSPNETTPGVLDTMKTLHKQGGMNALFKGWAFRGVQMAASFMVIDQVRNMVGDLQIRETQEQQALNKPARLIKSPKLQQQHVPLWKQISVAYKPTPQRLTHKLQHVQRQWESQL